MSTQSDSSQSSISSEKILAEKKRGKEIYPKNVRAENLLFRIIRALAAFVLILVYTPFLWILV